MMTRTKFLLTALMAPLLALLGHRPARPKTPSSTYGLTEEDLKELRETIRRDLAEEFKAMNSSSNMSGRRRGRYRCPASTEPPTTGGLSAGRR